MKKIPFLKIFLIASVWCIVLVFLPFLVSENDSNFSMIYFFFLHFVFFIMITLPFDVRDIEMDKEKGIITLPNYFGLEKTKSIISSLTVFYQVILIAGYFLEIVPLVFLLVSVAISSLFYLFAQRKISKQSELFIGFFYDGLLILQAVFILLLI